MPFLRVQLITLLASPLFDYSNGVLIDLTRHQRLKLKRLMNACMRFIYDLCRDEHVFSWYKRLEWLFADDRKEYLTCCLIFLIIYSGFPFFWLATFNPFTDPSLISALFLLLWTLPSCRVKPQLFSAPFIS